MRDLIERQVAIDAHCELCVDRDTCNCDICPDFEVFQLLPLAQPEPLTEEEMRLLKKLRSYHNGSYAKLLDKLVAYAQSDKDALDDAYAHGWTDAESKYRKMMDEKPEVIRCKDCKHQVKEWRDDKRLKDKGYWVYGCQVISDLCGYWAWFGQDDEFCSEAERRTDETQNT